jgi:hypothetical protein
MPGESVMNNEHDLEFAAHEVAGNEHDNLGRLAAEPAMPSGILATLLSPQTLQILMLSGGGLLVFGLVIWLWAQGVFENSLITAVCLGVVNLGVLAAGMIEVRNSRYQTAGMALTILACLVLPLNLWFYDAQGLVTLDQGGHLWVAALVCCSLYVGVAWILANPVFVYSIVGGVALTGMLFLADQKIDRFWEITSPSALLMVIGMVCIHAERLFPMNDGPFSRAKFGTAFFRAGHMALAMGMSILISGHLVGWVYEPLFAEFGWFPEPAVATQTNLKVIALMLSIAAAYSYLYSQIVVADRGRYTASAIATLLWCGLITMDLLAIPFTMEVAALIAAGGALLASLPALFKSDEQTESSFFKTYFGNLVVNSGMESVARGMKTIATLLVACLYVRARFAVPGFISPYQFSGVFVLASVFTAAATWLASRKTTGFTRQFQLSTVAVLGVLSVAGMLGTMGYGLSTTTLIGEMMVPLAIAGFAAAVAKNENQKEWAVAAESAVAVLLAVGCGVAIGIVDAVATQSPHLWLTVFFAQAAVCFGLTSRHEFRVTSAVGAVVSMCGLIWQLLLALGVTQYVFLYATLLMGISATVATVLAGEASPFKTVAKWTSRVCLSYGGVATMLLGLARLLTGESQWAVVGLLAAYLTASAIAAWLADEAKWRQHFSIVSGLQLVLMLFTIGALSTLDFVQRLELLITAAGLFLFAAGMVGWRREGETRDPIVSYNLAFGSILSTVPLLFGMICQRLGWGWNDWVWIMFHELGVLVVGLVLLGAGVLCRIRWSTLTGAASLAIYVLSLVLLVRLPDQLQTTAIYMMVGGGVFFAAAVLLSIYRDRLLALPQKVKSGEGVFEVLTWR